MTTTAHDAQRGEDPSWCKGCSPDNCMGCYIPGNATTYAPNESLQPKGDSVTRLVTPAAQQAATVPMPTDEDQAAAMAMIGHAWLRDNAPHRLATQPACDMADLCPGCPGGCPGKDACRDVHETNAVLASNYIKAACGPAQPATPQAEQVALEAIRSIKSSLVSLRMRGPNTLQGYRTACFNAELTCEEAIEEATTPPQAVQPTLINGLTQAETEVTASVMGLTASLPTWENALDDLCDEAESNGNSRKWVESKASVIRSELTPRPSPAPVRLLWQVRNALALACAICDAVPNRDGCHLGKLVNAQPDGSHGYRQIHDALESLDAHLGTPEAAVPEGLLEWTIGRWRDEVQNRPLVNKHRRTLDDTWRQVIRFAGGDPDELVGPSHDALAAAPQPGEES